MINTIIIEDERPAMENLSHVISGAAEDVNIIARLDSVKEGIGYLAGQPPVDLIFSDVQLGDGLSFEIFNTSRSRIPVIFTTGYDEFMMNAFAHNGIDYLLKPVDPECLRKALVKYRMLENHFSAHHSLDRMLQYISAPRKKRLIVKKGMEHISLRLEDTALIYTESKIVYVIDCGGKKYMIDKSMGELEEMLNDDLFFRANRQYIVNINFVKGYKAFEKVKLQVDLTLPELNHNIIVSQETAPQFREWMFNA